MTPQLEEAVKILEDLPSTTQDLAARILREHLGLTPKSPENPLGRPYGFWPDWEPKPGWDDPLTLEELGLADVDDEEFADHDRVKEST